MDSARRTDAFCRRHHRAAWSIRRAAPVPCCRRHLAKNRLTGPRLRGQGILWRRSHDCFGSSFVAFYLCRSSISQQQCRECRMVPNTLQQHRPRYRVTEQELMAGVSRSTRRASCHMPKKLDDDERRTLLLRQFRNEIMRRHLRSLPIFKTDRWLPDTIRELLKRIDRKPPKK